MALVVNTNVPSIASQRYLMESRKEMETAMERLSSGKRINSAADDAAGLAIANRMTTQIQGLNVAIRNANDGMSVVQTAEGAMAEVTDMLQRMRDLALQAVHGVNNDADRSTLDAEVQALKAEIDRVSETTTFNNKAILDGTYNVLLQIGKDASETMALNVASVATAALGLATSSVNSSDPIQTIVSQRLSSLADFDAGDIEIDGTALRALDVSGGDDISDLVTNINADIETVTASGFNTVVAKNAGTGVIAADTMAISVGAIGAVGDADYQAAKEVFVAASGNMDELVANINAAFFDGEVVASQTDDGKLVLSNSNGATISVAEASATGQGTTNAYDGGSGFLVSTSTSVASGTAVYATAQQFSGFLKLSSVDDSPITIDMGNQALTSANVGTVSDLAAIGFQRILEDPEGNYNQLVGTTFTTSTSTALGFSSTTGQADLTINGVEIYDSTLAAASTSFQGKLDLINAFSDETGVVASAYFEKSFDTTSTTFISNQTFRINGVQMSYGTSAAAMVSNINAATGTHGLTAELKGRNIVLSGDNVQNVNILAEDYAVTDDTSTIQPGARRSADTAPTAQSLTIGDTIAKEGRVFQLTIYASGAAGVTAGSNSALTIADTTILYTAASGASGDTVAEGLRNKLYSALQAGGLADTGVYSVYATAASGVLTFNSAMSVGDRKIELSIVNPTAANEALGGSQTLYGGLKLSSIDGDPISIELGENRTAAQHSAIHGFTEMNVGDSTYDVNDPTFEMTDVVSTSTVSGLSIASSDAAEAAITVLDGALESVIQMRADLGAVENRLDHTVSNLSNVVENTSAARSRIEDADFALEAAALARAQILQQAGTAMLAQANAAPQNVLSLLG